MPELGPLLEREMEEIRPSGSSITDVARRRDRRRRNQRIGTAVVALAIGAVAVAGLVQVFGHVRSDVPAGPGRIRNGRIAFVSPGQSGPTDRIYTAAPDGGGLRQLTATTGEYPVWSPDGSRIAFDDGSTVAIRDWTGAQGHVYVVNADGTGSTQVTSGAGAEFTPSWSPDGTQIALTATGQAGSGPGIFVLDLATREMRPITQNPHEGYLDKEPDYSPDGARIVFVRDRQLVEAGGSIDEEALFVVNADGSGLRRLTPWEAGVGTPSWSPDGTTILFRGGTVAQAPTGPSQIFVIGADGGGTRQLTFGSTAASFWPSWAPDGERIIFTRWDFERGGLELRTMNRDGSDVAPILQPDMEANQASWGTHP
jgi:TolB protein